MKVLFQPIVRLEDRTIAGFESLLRWDHPELGRLGPDDFMSVAEETGSSSISAFSCSSAPPANSPPGRARSKSIRRSSPASTCRAASCSGTISSTK